MRLASLFNFLLGFALIAGGIYLVIQEWATLIRFLKLFLGVLLIFFGLGFLFASFFVAKLAGVKYKVR